MQHKRPHQHTRTNAPEQLVANDEHGLAQVEGVEARVCVDGEDGVGADQLLVVQPVVLRRARRTAYDRHNF